MTGNPDNKVGYCQPPEHGKIKPGERRNPWGRRGKKGAKPELGIDSFPKTEMDLVADGTIEEMLRPVTVKVGGKAEKVPSHQALTRKLVNEALSGPKSAAALRLIYDRMDRAFEHNVERQQEFNAHLQTRLLEAEESVRIAKSNGGSGEDIVPHPRDFVRDLLRELNRLEGPVDHEERSLEYNLLRHRDDAETVMETSYRDYWATTSAEERKVHREALNHAKSVWTYYNEKVGRRVRRPQWVLQSFRLDEDAGHDDGSLRIDHIHPSGKIDRNAFVAPAPAEAPHVVEKKRLEKMHYQARSAVQFDLSICVERCRKATSDEEKAHHREELDRLKALWRQHNAGVHHSERSIDEVIHSWDPDRVVVEPERPEEMPEPAEEVIERDENDLF